MFQQKSFNLKNEDLDRKWHLVDATNKTVGRLATQVADLLRGKANPKFTPNVDSGDFVVVVNAEKVNFTGKKWDNKEYFWHSNHIGGIKMRTAREQLAKHPELIVMDAVKGMLPKNSLGRKQLTKLKMFVGAQHSHEAQNPIPFNVQ